MRFVTFEDAGNERLGAVVDGEIADLSGVSGLSGSLLGTIQVGEPAFAAAQNALRAAARRPLEETKLLPVIPRPGKIVCLGLNYAEHAAEGGREKPDYPNFFMRCATTLIGHGEAIIRPRVSEQLDFEAELAAVIGRRVPRHVAKTDALSYVAGYACFNDASVRDYQRRTPQWTIGKNFDATGPFGPVFVTADELPAGQFRDTLLSLSPRARGRALGILRRASTPAADFEFMRVDERGGIFYVDPAADEASEGGAESSPAESIAAEDVFKLHSKPNRSLQYESIP